MNDSIHQVLAELIGNGALDFKTAGLGIWSGLAFVMVLWTGIKTAASRRFDAWEATRLVVVLGVARTMLAFY